MVTKALVRDAFFDSDKNSDDTAYLEKHPSLTVQADSFETDINEIVRRFGIGHPPPVNVRAPSYGDFTGLTDFQSAMDALDSATESFMAMPAEVRSRFENDPSKFVDFCSALAPDGKTLANLEEMRKLGLAVPAPAVPAPVPAPAPTPPPVK